MEFFFFKTFIFAIPDDTFCSKIHVLQESSPYPLVITFWKLGRPLCSELVNTSVILKNVSVDTLMIH